MISKHIVPRDRHYNDRSLDSIKNNNKHNWIHLVSRLEFDILDLLIITGEMSIEEFATRTGRSADSSRRVLGRMYLVGLVDRRIVEGGNPFDSITSGSIFNIVLYSVSNLGKKAFNTACIESWGEV